ncbi:WAT1-related protein At2g37460-like [Wolffia australiana]
MGCSEVWMKAKAYFLMIFLQVGFAGMYVISVASLKQGMNHFVLVVYRNAVAAAVVAPFAFWFERKARPKMTVSCILKIMLLALLEPVLDQNFYYVGAKLTSASYSAAMFNMLPAVTFLLAIFLRMEKIMIRERRGQAKIIGTLITVGGALVMIMYKGPILGFFWAKGMNHHEDPDSAYNSANWAKGTLLLIACCFCWSAFFIVQSNTLRSFPAELTLTTWICAMGAAESAVVTLIMSRGIKPWAIGFDLRLLTVAYSGIMCSGVAYYVQGIVMKERGPVFVTAFNPLCMIIVAAMGSFILAEEITLGRVIGALVIVVGLYMLIWGKNKDYAMERENKTAVELPMQRERKKSDLSVDSNGDETFQAKR